MNRVQRPDRFHGEGTSGAVQDGIHDGDEIAPRGESLQRPYRTALLHLREPPRCARTDHSAIRLGERECRRHSAPWRPKCLLSVGVLL